MKIFLFINIINLFFLQSNAQYVSFNSKEIKQLKFQIQNDSEVSALYAPFEKTAKKYLNDSPNPIDTIRTEGLLKGNPKKERTNQSLPDFNKMFVLALQYRLTEDVIYLNKCADFLVAWAKINRPQGDPIDDTQINKGIEAYDLVKEDLADSSRAVILDWFTKTALAEINSKYMVAKRATATNNWNAHRLKIVGEIGFVLNNKTFINWTIENLKKHIAVNLYPDGTSLDFKQRDAMHYHIYDLEPMLVLIKAIKKANQEDFYTYESTTGSSIKKSVDWLIPYMNNEKQHEEYVNTTVNFDRLRAKNNEPGFAPGTMFKPKTALPVFKIAVYFDPVLKNILDKVNPTKKNWEMVLNELSYSQK